MSWSNDPVSDFLLHDTKQAKELEKLPKCADCDEPIQEDYYYEINGEPICQNCLDSNYRKHTEDFID